jgi:CHAD domain-containing protein
MREPAVLDFLVSGDVGSMVAELSKRFKVSMPESTVEEVSYLDTFDWRLWQRGWVLRAQFGDEQDVRLNLVSLSGVLLQGCCLSRVPVFAVDLADTALYPRLEGVLDQRRLLVQARCSQQRTGFRMLGSKGKTQARLDLVETTLIKGRQPMRWRRLPTVLRLTGLRGFGKAYRETVRILRDDLSLRPLESSEAQRVFLALGIVPGKCTSRIQLRLNRGTTADEAVRSLFRSLWQTARRNERGILQELDSEFLHDFRVALRRTRVVLRELKEVVPRQDQDRFSAEMRWLGELTRRARDLDVQLEDLKRWGARFAPSQIEDLQPVLDWVNSQRDAAYSELKAGLRSVRYRSLGREWASFLESPWGTPSASKSVELVASARILQVCRKVAKQGSRMTGEEDIRQYHRLRIRCKKLRYLLELFRDLYPSEPVKMLIKALKDLQDCLGRLNDLSVQKEILENYLADRPHPGGPGPSVVVERLLERLEAERTFERHRFRECFALFAEELGRSRLKQILKGEEAAS